MFLIYIYSILSIQSSTPFSLPQHPVQFFATGTEQHFRTSVWVLGDLKRSTSKQIPTPPPPKPTQKWKITQFAKGKSHLPNLHCFLGFHVGFGKGCKLDENP